MSEEIQTCSWIVTMKLQNLFLKSNKVFPWMIEDFQTLCYLKFTRQSFSRPQPNVETIGEKENNECTWVVMFFFFGERVVMLVLHCFCINVPSLWRFCSLVPHRPLTGFLTVSFRDQTPKLASPHGNWHSVFRLCIVIVISSHLLVATKSVLR